MFELALPAAPNLKVRAPVPSPCSVYRNISIHSREIGRSRCLRRLGESIVELLSLQSFFGLELVENSLAYSNARLPQALIRAGMRAANDEMVSAGLEALDWLVTIQRCEVKGHFVPIGSQGFYSKENGKGAIRSTTGRSLCCGCGVLAAYRASGKGRWRKKAWSAFNCVLGR